MEKQCIKCSVSKDLQEFYNSKTHKDGKMGTCKVCFNLNSATKYRPKSYSKNKEKIQKRYSEWRHKNKEYVEEWHKQWRKEHTIDIKNYAKKYRENPIHRLKANIRTRIAQQLTGFSKSKKTLDILGVDSFKTLQEHIESNFTTGMSWENYGLGEGKWVVDHKIPLSAARDEQEVYELNHFTNLQPMWWRENMEKGSKV